MPDDRLTREALEKKIKEKQFVHHKHVTIAVVEMDNGYIEVGSATPADPSIYDPDIGEKAALADAMSKLLGAHAYLLKELTLMGVITSPSRT